MAVKHRKLSRAKGDNALAALRAELKATLAAIEEEAEFAAKTAPAGPNASDLVKRFPALGARR